MSKRAGGKKRGHKSQGRPVEESQQPWRFGAALLTPREIEQGYRERAARERALRQRAENKISKKIPKKGRRKGRKS